MQRCPKCGTEFEGKFCPQCGEAWREEKTCPNCGTKLAGSARFCNECGYSFTKQPPATATSKPSAFTAVKGWVAVHKKQTIIIAALLIVGVLLAIILPIVIANRFNGTYYRFTNEKYNYDDMLILTKDKWEQGALSGTFEVDGEKITMRYVDYLGITETQTGTIKDGVITLGSGNMEVVYAKKGALHEHSYGAWTVRTPSTCLARGTEARVCVTCGKEETRTLPFGDHTATWIMEDKSHSKVCDLCGANIVTDEEHVDDGNGNCSICGCPLTPTEGLIYEQQDKGYFVKGIGTAGGPVIRISEIYQDLPVVGIAEEAFKACDLLTTIIMPNSVTKIEWGAFRWCSSLTSIAIPESVTSIGDYAFSGCSSLTSINISEGVTSIGYAAFRSCSSLTSIKIPESVTSIGNYAFDYCSSLTSIIIPEGVTSIGEYAFYDCDSLQSITIPEGVTSIGEGAFRGCSSLQSVTFSGDSKLTSIGKQAFYSCDSLNAVYITNFEAWCRTDFGDDDANPLSHAHHLYVDGQEVTDLHIPDGVTKINHRAFTGGSFTSVTIPESVTSIGSRAFYDCDSLTSITIQESGIWIGYQVFYGTAFYNDDANWINDILYIGDYLIVAKETISGNVTIKEGTKLIANYAFLGCVSLESITLPESVTSIGNYAFEDCSSLQTVTFEGDSRLTSLEDMVFYNCSSLISITIPASVTSIGSYAFEDCSSLQTVTFAGDSQLTSIGNYAFDYCSSLTSIIIPEGVTSIGKYAFWNCGSLTSITIPEGVTSIGDSAFYNCYKLIEVWNYSQLPIKKGNWSYGDVAYYAKHVYTANEQSKQTVTEDGYIFYEDGNEVYLLGYTGNKTSLTLPAASPSGKDYAIYQYAFYDCDSLQSITIPEGVTSIGDSAFYNCDSLTSITIPEGVTSIEEGAFRGCSSLRSVTFEGDGQLTSIGENAFCYCTSLTSITIPEGVTSIGEWAFCNCSSLTSITIPESVAWIGDYAFEDCSSLNAVYITNLEAWCGIDFGDDYANPLYNAHHLYVDGEEVTNLRIPNGVKEIKNYAFWGCSSLTSVTIPVGVTSIGEWAFCNCSSLTSITIPEGVTSIGSGAFGGCYKLIEVWNYSALPLKEGDKEYGYVAYYAKHVYTVNEQSKQTVTEDGYIFYEDDNEVYLLGYTGNETSLTLPAASPSGKDYQIYLGAFWGYSSLESVTIPAGVTSIGNAAFYDCDSLTSITIPESVTSIGYAAFYDCDSLQSVIFERTDGWKVSRNSDMSNAIDVSVSDPQTAAEYLTNYYGEYDWKRY